jgi:hypothetical protein
LLIHILDHCTARHSIGELPDLTRYPQLAEDPELAAHVELFLQACHELFLEAVRDSPLVKTEMGLEMLKSNRDFSNISGKPRHPTERDLLLTRIFNKCVASPKDCLQPDLVPFLERYPELCADGEFGADVVQYLFALRRIHEQNKMQHALLLAKIAEQEPSPPVTRSWWRRLFSG